MGRTLTGSVNAGSATGGTYKDLQNNRSYYLSTGISLAAYERPVTLSISGDLGVYRSSTKPCGFHAYLKGDNSTVEFLNDYSGRTLEGTYNVDSMALEHKALDIMVAAYVAGDNANGYCAWAGSATITVTTVYRSFSINKSSSGSGTVTCVGSAEYGSSVTATASPGTGYTIESFTVSGAASGNGTNASSSRTFTMGAQTVSISVKFKKISYTVTKNNGVTGPSTATYQDTVTVSGAPSTGYHTATITKDGTTIATNQESASFTMPAANVTIGATYAKNTYSLTYEAGTGGSFSTKPASALYDDNVTVSVTPDAGYSCSAIMLNGVAISGSGNSRTFNMPAGASTVTAEFTKNKYKVTMATDPEGAGVPTVSNSNPTYGDEVSISAAPGYGWKLTTDNTKYSASPAAGVTFTGDKFNMPPNDVTITVYYEIAYTPCTAPTAASFGASVVEGTTNMTWSGAEGGIENSITGYDIEYVDSANGATWATREEEADGETVEVTDWRPYTSASAEKAECVVSPPANRGHYRKFRIKTKGSAGSDWYSDWFETGAVRKNMLPAAPTSLSISPLLYEKGNITLGWTAAAPGTSAIEGYYVSYAISGSNSWDNVSWSSEEKKSSGCTYAPTLSRGSYIKFRIRSKDVLGAYSAYTQFASVRRNSAPSAPTNAQADNLGESSGSGYITSGANYVTWGASSDTNGNMDHYVVQWRIKKKGKSSYGEWQTLASVPYGTNEFEHHFNITADNLISGMSVGPASDFTAYMRGIAAPPVETIVYGDSLGEMGRGDVAQYRVKAVDALGAESNYAESGLLRCNQLPNLPELVCPTLEDCSTSAPRFRLKLTDDPDGQSLQIAARIRSASSSGSSNAVSITSLFNNGFAYFYIPPYRTNSYTPGSSGTRLSDGTYKLEVALTDGIETVEYVYPLTFTLETTEWSRTIEAGDVISDTETSHVDDMNEMLVELNKRRKWYGLSQNPFPSQVGYFASWLTLMNFMQDRIVECYHQVGTNPTKMIQTNQYPTAALVNHIRSLIEGC